jgi:hypothetical protein
MPYQFWRVAESADHTCDGNTYVLTQPQFSSNEYLVAALRALDVLYMQALLVAV